MSIDFQSVVPNSIVSKNSFCIAEYRAASIAKEIADRAKNFFEEKRSSPNNP